MTNQNVSFAGKRALVTGAAGGIGQEVSRKLIERGAHVMLTDLNEQMLRETCAAFGENAHWISGDLLEARFADNLVPNTVQKLGGLDMVINNAGIIRRGHVLDASDDDWHLSMTINVEAVFRICRSAIRAMTEQKGGAIVNVASCWGLHPGPDHVVYCTSKAAVAAMTQCLGRDHAHANVRVNAVAPNEVDTPMLRSGFVARGFDPGSAVAELNKTVPIGHIASPNEIADVIVFLCSERSRYICGECIEVNGGKAVY